MKEEKLFYRPEDIAEILQVSKDTGYKIIRQLNKELQEKGFITVRARVNANYFRKRVCYGEE